MSRNVTISSTVRTYPTHSYEQIKDAILGKRYALSLVFVGEQRAQTLNKKYRNKSYIPNVLSFPLDTAHGEIYIAPSVARREAKKWNMTPEQHVGFLFIHGLLHLKGYRHGATMSTAEKRYLKRYILS